MGSTCCGKSESSVTNEGNLKKKNGKGVNCESAE